MPKKITAAQIAQQAAQTPQAAATKKAIGGTDTHIYYGPVTQNFYTNPSQPPSSSSPSNTSSETPQGWFK